MKDRRVVITGLGSFSNLGVGKEEFYQNWKAGRNGVKKKEDWNAEEYEIGEQFFGSLEEYSFKSYFQELKPPFPMRYSQLAMIACKMAIEDSKIHLEEENLDRAGLMMTTDYGANTAVEKYLTQLFVKGPGKVRPFAFTKTVANCALGDTSRHFKLRGPSSLLLGENSVCYGFDSIKDNKADVMICGGFDEIRDVTMWNLKNIGHILEPNESADYASVIQKDLETQKDKIVLGEGAAFVVMEEYEHAVERGATIYAEVLNHDSRCDVENTLFIFKRDVDLMEKVVENCLSDQCKKEDVKTFHGAASMPWQVAEQDKELMNKVWSDNYQPNYRNVKIQTGENYAASPVLSLIIAALELKETSTSENYSLVNGNHAGGNISSLLLRNFSAN